MPSPTQINMQLMRWQLDSDQKKLSGVVVFDLTDTYNPGAAYSRQDFKSCARYDGYFLVKTYTHSIMLWDKDKYKG